MAGTREPTTRLDDPLQEWHITDSAGQHHAVFCTKLWREDDWVVAYLGDGTGVICMFHQPAQASRIHNSKTEVTNVG